MPTKDLTTKIAILVFGDLVSDPRVEREAQALSEAGYMVRIFALKRSDLPELEQRHGFEIQRCAEFTTAPAWRLLKKWTQLKKRRRDYKEALTSWRPDVIQACDVDTLAIADQAATLLDIPYILDAHELYSDRLQVSKWSGSWPVQFFWKHLENRLIPKAARVLTVSEPLAAILEKRHGISVIVQHNVPPLAPLMVTGRLRRELELPDSEIIVLYQGVLNAGRDLFHMVKAFKGEPRAHLVIQGFGALSDEIEALIAREELKERVRFMGRVPAADLHEYACDATFGIICCDDLTLHNRVMAPNKLFGYLMAGLPVIATRMPFLQQVVEGEQVGHCFEPAGDLKALTAAVSEMVTLAVEERDNLSGGAYKEMSTRARQLAEQRYNWEAEKHILLDLYKEVLA